MTDILFSLSGAGEQLLASPKVVPSLGVIVTTPPPGLAVMDGGTPRRLMKVGWVALCAVGSDPDWPTDVFCDTAHWIDWDRARITYPAPGLYADRLRWHFEPGAFATVLVNDEVPPTVPNSAKMPWDRNPAPWTSAGHLVASPGETGTLWTYTVPGGRMFWLASAELVLNRLTASTAVLSAYMQLLRNGVQLSAIANTDLAPPSHERATLAPSDLVLQPGEVLEASYGMLMTGGTCDVMTSATGFTFDL